MSNMHQEMLRKKLLYLMVQDSLYTCLAGGEGRERTEINPTFPPTSNYYETRTNTHHAESSKDTHVFNTLLDDLENRTLQAYFNIQTPKGDAKMNTIKMKMYSLSRSSSRIYCEPHAFCSKSRHISKPASLVVTSTAHLQNLPLPTTDNLPLHDMH